MAEASCLCAAVRWRLGGPFQFMTHCHCSRCRKVHGAAFATYVAGPADTFACEGAANIARWESPPRYTRHFCRQCGSVVPGGEPYHDYVFAPVGNFLDDPGARPIGHLFVGSKAPWFEITDSLPQSETYPPGIDAAALPDRPPLDPPGAPRGSCLCGAVTFVLTGEPLMARNCHCSRCRRARSAAHASNMIVPHDAVRFTRGADAVRLYKLPEAKFFSQVFCTTCGSCVPRVDPNRGIAIVPMGCLDDDPGIRPLEHIFVADKAPWYEITDDLPQVSGPPASPLRPGAPSGAG